MKKFLTTTVAGIILLGLSTNWLYDILKTVPILGPVSRFLNDIRIMVGSFLSVKLPLWLFLVIVFFLAILYLSLKRFASKKLDLPYLTYTRERFKSWIWRWDYDRDGFITNLTAYCPQCDVPLVATNIGQRHLFPPGEAHCPQCETAWHADARSDRPVVEYRTDIQALIISKMALMTKAAVRDAKKNHRS